MWFKKKNKSVEWKNEPPDREGYYWVRTTNGDYDFKHIVYVLQDSCSPDSFSVLWYGDSENDSFNDMEDYYWGPEVIEPE